LGSSKRRHLIRDVLYDHSIDLVGLQEIKKETFRDRTLKALSKTINDWIILPSEGKSGGILVGYNTDKFKLLNKWILTFSITLLIRNKIDDYIWMFTTVYGPTLLNLRNEFWNELNNIRNFLMLLG
jgi:mRNA deadenylase 3'-5' endonuclease subunit Ccr4